MISIKSIARQTFGWYIDKVFGHSSAPVLPVVELAVPFAEKDEAKRLGAKWNPERKVWFVPAGQDPSSFARWLLVPPAVPAPKPVQMIHAPVWLMTTMNRCYRCDKDTSVFALSAQILVDFEHDDDGEIYYQQITTRQHGHISLYNLEMLDVQVASLLKQIAPNFRLDHSKTQARRVYMNHCQHCAAKLGDYFMHCEPGGAFCPSSSNAREVLDQMKTTLVDQGEYKLRGTFGLLG
jgi:uncharacterized protein (DUF2164 family)